MNGLVQLMDTFPISSRNGSIYRQRPIVRRIPPRHEIAMPIGNIALIIGIDGIVGRIGPDIHGLFILVETIGLGDQPRFQQGIQRSVVLPQAQPPAIPAGHHRSMTGKIPHHRFHHQHAIFFIIHRERPCGHRHRLSFVFIDPILVLLPDLFRIQIRNIRKTGSMHPPAMGIETLINEELPPGNSAIDIQPFLADQLHFHPEVKGDMRIDI